MKRKKVGFNLKWILIWTIVLVVYLFPYIWLVQTGFRKPIETFQWPPKFFFVPNLTSFRELYFDIGVVTYLKNSIIVSIFGTTLTLFFALPLAYALAHLKLKGKTGILFGMLLVRMIPPLAFVVPFFLIALQLHFKDTVLGLILIYAAFNIPFAVWVLRSFFSDIPKEIREAAIVDGCSEYGAFGRVILPLSLAGLGTTSVFVFIYCWNEFMFALALTSTNAITLPVLAASFRTEYGIEWSRMSAAAFIISIPVIIFAMFMQRYLIRGLTMGAVKE